jgi:hypothetical protein
MICPSQTLQEWPGARGGQQSQAPLESGRTEEAATTQYPRESEGVGSSEGSDEAETVGLWWHGHFIQAGRAGSAYTSFASETKVPIPFLYAARKDGPDSHSFDPSFLRKTFAAPLRTRESHRLDNSLI